MQEKFKQILKNASIFTTDPDKDWRRLFASLICLVLVALVWSFFFFTRIQQDIADSEAKQAKGTSAVVSEKEDELRDLVVELETKKSKNNTISAGGYTATVSRFKDPSR